jgi:hypothetical protein
MSNKKLGDPTKRISIPIYLAIASTTILYILVLVATIIAYKHFSSHISSLLYYGILIIELVTFIIVLGLFIMLNKHRELENIQMETEKRELTNLSVKVQEIHQNFTNYKSLFEVQAYRNVERDIRKLKEKLQFCTPFGRSVPEVEEIEKQIEDEILSLGKLISDIQSTPKEELAKTLENIKYLTTSIVQAMERREKLLIK